MNFKNLLEKYKSGAATPEEKQFVETELEKNEAINDYLSEQLTAALPDTAGVENAFARKAEAVKIRRRINRKFLLTIAASVALAAALACITLFAVFPAVNDMYYNPLKGHGEISGVHGGQLAVDLSVFSELRLSGYETPFASVKGEGFGVYDVTIYQYNVFRNFTETPIHAKIVRGEFNPSIWGTPFTDGVSINWVQSAYGNYTDTGKISVIHQAAARELARLPESARVKAYLFFENGIDMRELERLRKEIPALIMWAGIKSDDSENLWNVRFGFSPSGKRSPLSARHIYGADAYDESEYPLLELDPSEPSGGVDAVDEARLTAAAYETHFLSMLKYMGARREFWDLIGFSADYQQDVRQAMEYVEQNGVLCITVVAAGTRDEITALAENPLIKYIALDDVMISEFSRH